MQYVQVVSIEFDKYQEALPQWADALSTHVGRIPPSGKDEEVIRCLPRSLGRFSGRIEAGVLGDMVLAKLGATPYQFSRSLRTPTPTPTLPLQALLLMQVSGGGCLAQHDRSCTLYPGDWLSDTSVDQFDSSSLGDPSECRILVLERPTDPNMLALLERGVARRFDSKAGMSRSSCDPRWTKPSNR